jgi:hypothetical protein
MATPAANLASSLEVLKQLQERGLVAIRATDMSRLHRGKYGLVRIILGFLLRLPE